MQLGAVNETAVAEVNTTLEKNQLALQVLHKLGVIPEHIESRTLYNDDCPGIPQVIHSGDVSKRGKITAVRVERVNLGPLPDTCSS